MALVESLACGTPLVDHHRTARPRSWCDPGVTGELCPPGDPASLADALPARIRARAPSRATVGACRARRGAFRLGPRPGAPVRAALPGRPTSVRAGDRRPDHRRRRLRRRPPGPHARRARVRRCARSCASPQPRLEAEQIGLRPRRRRRLAAHSPRPAAGVDAVVHLAGENEVLAGRRAGRRAGGTVVATERVAEAARRGRRRPPRLHVDGACLRRRGSSPGAEPRPRSLRAEPRSAYAISRLASEHVAATFAATYELVVLRLTNSVGAPDRPGGRPLVAGRQRPLPPGSR